MLAHEPTALDFVTGCAVRFPLLIGGDRTVGEEVLKLFEQAQERFVELPPVTQAHADIRAYMAFGYLLAALAADLIGDSPRAMRVAEAGAQFDPGNPVLPSRLTKPDGWVERGNQAVAEAYARFARKHDDGHKSLESLVTGSGSVATLTF